MSEIYRPKYNIAFSHPNDVGVVFLQRYVDHLGAHPQITHNGLQLEVFVQQCVVQRKAALTHASHSPRTRDRVQTAAKLVQEFTANLMWRWNKKQKKIIINPEELVSPPR